MAHMDSAVMVSSFESANKLKLLLMQTSGSPRVELQSPQAWQSSVLSVASVAGGVKNLLVFILNDGIHKSLIMNQVKTELTK